MAVPAVSLPVRISGCTCNAAARPKKPSPNEPKSSLLWAVGFWGESCTFNYKSHHGRKLPKGLTWGLVARTHKINGLGCNGIEETGSWKL